MTRTNPVIYVACLASYNSAILHGEWIEVTDELIVREQIQEMLDNSPIEDSEEFAIHDYEGFGSFRVHEYESISDICELADLIREHGDIIVELFAYHSDLEFAKSELEKNYYGEHKSEQDFANEIFDDFYANQIPEPLMCYIDFEAFTTDLFINDFYSIETNSGVHVFSNH